jgi:hypothetical protein
MLKRTIVTIAGTLFCAFNNVRATVVEFTNKSLWQTAAGSYTTIHFTELPNGTLVTNQYANLGVTFTDGSDYILVQPTTFLNDGAGLNGAFDSVSLAFASPMQSIAIDFPGSAEIDLYSQGQLIYASTDFGGSGLGHFAGLISDLSFDAARIFDPEGGVFIDDLHFGPPIPGPGALPVIATGLLAMSRRKGRLSAAPSLFCPRVQA